MKTEMRKGEVMGLPAPDFGLIDDKGNQFNLAQSLVKSSVMLVFYPGDFTPVCTAQLCDYRESMAEFESYGIQLFGISPNSMESHAKFSEKHQFPFLLLTDTENKIAKKYGCSSLFMFGRVSRAVILINQKGFVLYKYVEPTVLTRRKSSELVDVISQLRKNGLF